jgi:hypothetical protein
MAISSDMIVSVSTKLSPEEITISVKLAAEPELALNSAVGTESKSVYL